MSKVMNRQNYRPWQFEVLQQCWLIIATFVTIPSAIAAPLEVTMQGTVLGTPCKIRAGDEALTVDLGTVVDKYLYINTRTPGKPFYLHLDDCDTTRASAVRLTFNGKENSSLPGLLAVNAGSGASGIAVGIETGGASSTPLPLNVRGPENLLSTTSRTTILSFKAYVQAEPQALASKTIGLGAFSASATFLLDYQ
ncbi:fimbrial protein [Enterobacter sp. AG326]|uniref:fimbrial protein n=1 Tax=Enterobacter sp. AG326 TaxID=2183902 RepID=UPI001FB5C5AF|nr:fimbrial protein [Enterobacter sp. AG326]